MTLSRLIVGSALLLVFRVSAVVANGTPEVSKPTARTERVIEVWTLRLDDRLVRRENEVFCSELLASFARRLADIRAVVGPEPQAATVLWYERPAERWMEALPVGNGRLGAMVFGGPGEERIQFNEETRWSGGPYDPAVGVVPSIFPKAAV